MKEEFFMNNKEKCDKFEAYFVFKDENEFLNHVKNCPDCQREYEKHLKVSKLVKEAAPEYLKKQQKQKITAIKRLACCFVMFLGITAFTGYNMYDNYITQQDIEEDSCISTMGLPIDDYGFLAI